MKEIDKLKKNKILHKFQIYNSKTFFKIKKKTYYRKRHNGGLRA